MADELPPAPTLDQILSAPVAQISSSANETVRQLGRTYGVRMGAANRAQAIRVELNAKAAQLDALLPFHSLLISEASARAPGANASAWILPPVLTEARDEVSTTGQGQQIRLTTATYRIVSPPRYVAVVPTWRDFLLPALTTLESQRREPDFKPKPGTETDAWKQGVSEGWSHGVMQAGETYRVALEMAERQFKGMMLYHHLRRQGMVTAPIETTESVSVAKSGNDALIVGQRTFTISSTSVWNDQASTWKAFGQTTQQAPQSAMKRQ
jgi:defect in organelle trafficking protein DotC